MHESGGGWRFATFATAGKRARASAARRKEDTMGRQTLVTGGLREADHLELGVELSAIDQALVDVRKLITARMRSGSPAYLAVGRVLREVRGLARVLDEDLRDAYGAKVELRKCYREILQ
jgi:hypothetical protein